MRPRGLSESMVPASGSFLKEQQCEPSKMSGTSRHTYMCAESTRAWARELVEALGTTAMQTHSSAGWFFHLGGLSWSEGMSFINKTHGGFWMHSFEASLTRGRNMPRRECTTFGVLRDEPCQEAHSELENRRTAIKSGMNAMKGKVRYIKLASAIMPLR